MKRVFIAGTDTGVGKTLVSAALLLAAKQAGLETAAIKPIAAGCELSDDGLRNEDALELMRVMTKSLSYQQVNPVALEPAIAPHIAAQQAERRISVDRLAGFCQGVFGCGADFTVVEGAGGWRVPLNYSESIAGLPKVMNLPVILVVGMRLGCINHALLTAEAIRRDGLPVRGWVANQIDPDMPVLKENIETLERLLSAPKLAEIPFMAKPSAEKMLPYFSLEGFFEKKAV